MTIETVEGTEKYTSHIYLTKAPRRHRRLLDCAFEDATVSYDTQTYLDETTHLSATQTVKCEDMLHELIQLSLTPSTR